MSRLNSLTASAIRAMHAQQTDEELILLVTITDPTDLANPIRLCDNYTGRLTNLSTDTEIVYGTVSRGEEYIYLPLTIGLPQEQETGVGTCSLQLNYVTAEAIVLIREKLTKPTAVTIELVLSSNPHVVEASFSGFDITSATYSADVITLDLSMVSLSREPFPCYNFTPGSFPGLF